MLNEVKASHPWVDLLKPETVIEFKVTDVQGEDSSGEQINRMVLEHGERGWTTVREMPGASILHPVFVRVRDDKSVNPTDIRVAQVLERCLIETDSPYLAPVPFLSLIHI